MVNLQFPSKGSLHDIDGYILEPGEAIEDDHTIERIINRHRLGLELVGEWCVVFKIKTSGIKCPCVDNYYDQNQDFLCNVCFGTTWVGGYDLFEYDVDLSGNPFVKDGHKFLARIIRNATNIELTVNIGLVPIHTPMIWCLAPPLAPELASRDIIAPAFNFDRIGIQQVRDVPIVRGKDVIENDCDVIYKISFIKSDPESDEVFNQGAYRLMGGNKIEWIVSTLAPEAGSTYFVTYEKLVNYPQLYQIKTNKIPTVRGVATRQEAELVELPRAHPAYALLARLKGEK